VLRVELPEANAAVNFAAAITTLAVSAAKMALGVLGWSALLLGRA
jgi:hypothetical protein